MTRIRTLLPFLLIACLILTGCTQTQLTTSLDAVVGAVSVGSVVLMSIGPAAGIPPAIVDQVEGYLSDVASATPQVSAELKTSDPLETQIVKISGLLAPYLTKDIPGAPPQLTAIVQTVGAAIQVFLDQLKGTGKTAQNAAVSRAIMIQPGASAKVYLSRGDQMAIGRSVTKAAQVKANLDQWKTTRSVTGAR